MTETLGRFDTDAERPLSEDVTFQRALAKAAEILETRDQLEKDRDEYVDGLPHTD